MGPTIGQQIWSSLPGRMIQGGVVDPLSGFPQTVAHVVAPGSSYANFTDATVDAINQAYRAAQASMGQDPNAFDYGRKVGGLISPGALEVAPAKNILGHFITNAAESTANSLLTSPQDSDILNDKTYDGKKAHDAVKDTAIDEGKGLASEIKAAAKAKGWWF